MKKIFALIITLSWYMVSAAQNVGINTTAPQAYGHGGTNRILELKNDAGTGADFQSHLILSTNGTSGSLGTVTWAAPNIPGAEKRTGLIANVFETANATRLAFYSRTETGSITEKFSINGNGNVGIGNNIPNAPLSFANVLGRKITLFHGSQGNVGLGVHNNELRIHSDYDLADITFGYENNADIFTERMRIKGNGNVGIGNNNPNAPLAFPALLGKKITLYPGGTGDVGLAVQGNLLQIYADHPNADIAFGYDQGGVFTERMRIKGNGNVGIGTNTPLFKFQLGGTAVSDRKIGINGTQVLYFPDQALTAFEASFFAGDGGGFLSHGSGIDGAYNTGVGIGALYSNTTGFFNTATGSLALKNNITGFSNTAYGRMALYVSTGNDNTANGSTALSSNTSGSNNTAMGSGALLGNTTGSNNTGLGNFASVPSGTLNNQVRLGDGFISYAGVQVGWTITSDKRWKEDIRTIPYGLDMINRLHPVDYVRKSEPNSYNGDTREMGLIAQEVEETLNELGYQNSGIVTKDDKGYYGVRYNDFIPLIIKAVQEQQKNILEQQNMIDKQQQQIDELKKLVEKLLKQ